MTPEYKTTWRTISIDDPRSPTDAWTALTLKQIEHPNADKSLEQARKAHHFSDIKARFDQFDSHTKQIQAQALIHKIQIWDELDAYLKGDDVTLFVAQNAPTIEFFEAARAFVIRATDISTFECDRVMDRLSNLEGLNYERLSDDPFILAYSSQRRVYEFESHLISPDPDEVRKWINGIKLQSALPINIDSLTNHQKNIATYIQGIGERNALLPKTFEDLVIGAQAALLQIMQPDTYNPDLISVYLGRVKELCRLSTEPKSPKSFVYSEKEVLQRLGRVEIISHWMQIHASHESYFTKSNSLMGKTAEIALQFGRVDIAAQSMVDTLHARSQNHDSEDSSNTQSSDLNPSIDPKYGEILEVLSVKKEASIVPEIQEALTTLWNYCKENKLNFAESISTAAPLSVYLGCITNPLDQASLCAACVSGNWDKEHIMTGALYALHNILAQSEPDNMKVLEPRFKAIASFLQSQGVNQDRFVNHQVFKDLEEKMAKLFK